MTPLIFSSASSQRLLRLYRHHKVKVIYFTFNLEGKHQGALKRTDSDEMNIKGHLLKLQEVMRVSSDHPLFSLLTQRQLNDVMAHRVVQSINVQDDSLGLLVAGAQEELGFAAGADGLVGWLGLGAVGCLQELVDLRRQQLRLTRGGGPEDTRQDFLQYTYNQSMFVSPLIVYCIFTNLEIFNKCFTTGVPQGSVLGPLNITFLIFMKTTLSVCKLCPTSC